MRLGYIITLAIHVPFCGCFRNRVGVRDSAADPAWCTDIDPTKCTAIQERQCKETCKTGEIQKPDASPHASDIKQELDIVQVNEDTMPSGLMKVMKTSVYKNMWPETCEGVNKENHALVENLNTDGFACDVTDGGRIPPVTHPLWIPTTAKTNIHAHKYDVAYTCCNEECGDSSSCEVEPLKFWEAWQAVARAHALEVTELKTESGTIVKVNIKIPTPSVTEATGVLAGVEVRMLQSALEFEPGQPVLTGKGSSFFHELAKPLAALVTMQLSVWPGIDAKVLFCAHASTTAWKEKAIDPELSQKRAELVDELLGQVLPASGVASQGTPVGHFRDEVAGFNGGREAHIIYKVFDASKTEPTCEKADLYEFTS